MSIFTSKKVWNFFIKIQLKKSDPKSKRREKYHPSCQLGLRQLTMLSSRLENMIVFYLLRLSALISPIQPNQILFISETYQDHLIIIFSYFHPEKTTTYLKLPLSVPRLYCTMFAYSIIFPIQEIKYLYLHQNHLITIFSYFVQKT